MSSRRLDWTKLAWLATRNRKPHATRPTYEHAYQGLEVLQDALHEHLPTQFERAKERAERLARKKIVQHVVVFCPNLERARTKAYLPLRKPAWWPGDRASWETSYSASEEAAKTHRIFVEGQNWPFTVVSRYGLRRLRVGFPCVAVYDSGVKLDAHSLTILQERFKYGGPEAPRRRRRA